MKLSTKARKGLRRSQFALPASRKYPVHDRSHAANAKARASQMLKKKKISRSTRDKIFAAANRTLRRS